MKKSKIRKFPQVSGIVIHDSFYEPLDEAELARWYDAPDISP